jgi:thiol-disulfide isomerase/thioredoxin
VLIDDEGRIASLPAVGAADIRLLAERAIGSAAAPVRLAPVGLGDPAPLFTLPDLDGDDVSLLDFHGRLRLVVFWSPTCSFCRELHPLLRDWEAQLDPHEGPQLLIVSSGAVPVNAADRFRSPVLLEEGSLTQRAYGVAGTPCAVLIDAAGTVVAAPGSGVEAVMALAHHASVLARLGERVKSSPVGRRIPVAASATAQTGYPADRPEADQAEENP